MVKQDGELKVERLLLAREKVLLSKDYSNWPLYKVPFSEIWNQFSRSGQHLRED